MNAVLRVKESKIKCYCCVIKYRFKVFLKTFNDLHIITWRGSLFHTHGTLQLNSVDVTRLIGRLCCSLIPAPRVLDMASDKPNSSALPSRKALNTVTISTYFRKFSSESPSNFLSLSVYGKPSRPQMCFDTYS